MKKLLNALMLLAATAAAALAQESITIKFDAVNGAVCSSRAGAGTFAAQSWSFGASNQSIQTTGGQGTGKAQLTNLTIAKQLDECSTQLFGMSVQGTRINRLVLTQTDASGRITVTTVELNNAFVSSYQVTGNLNNATPVEMVSFSFAKITLTYQGGSGNSKFTWDAMANKAG